MRIKIKFCGGCKPEYDRPALARRLVEELAGLLGHPPSVVDPDEPAEVGLLLCGCAACCADRPENREGAGQWHLIGPGLLDYQSLDSGALAAELAAALRRRKGRQS